MPAILTVDDSRAIRAIVAKQVKDLGFEVIEAEDGVQGLDVLGASQVDLVLLDVTMPNMDGPTMLQKLRESGNQVPVIMLTSEAKRSTVAGAMRMGISDYILKPFKPEELRAKVLSVLQGEPASGAEAAVAESAPTGAPGVTPAGRFVDLMVVDDMDHVAKKLRGLVPPRLTLASYTNAQAALTACREKVFRVILVDTEIPDVDSAVLARQMRVLQPNAVVVALALKTTGDVQKESRDAGFDDVLIKPFKPEGVDDFLMHYFENQDYLSVEDNVLRIAPYTGRPEKDKVDRFYGRIATLFPDALEKMAAACYDDVVLDVGQPPLEGDRLPKLVNEIATRSREFGITLAVVGAPEVQKVLAGYQETKDLRFFGSVQEARAAAA